MKVERDGGSEEGREKKAMLSVFFASYWEISCSSNWLAENSSQFSFRLDRF